MTGLGTNPMKKWEQPPATTIGPLDGSFSVPMHGEVDLIMLTARSKMNHLKTPGRFQEKRDEASCLTGRINGK
jgi:hypothetical protein